MSQAASGAALPWKSLAPSPLSESPNKPREDMKRFAAACKLRGIGKLARVRTRWLADGTWSAPQEIEVAVLLDCKIEA